MGLREDQIVRYILHGAADVGREKVLSAGESLEQPACDLRPAAATSKEGSL